MICSRNSLSILLCFASISLSGCASVFFNDYKQVVRVMSEPPGADIYNQDGEKLGVTPAYVKVRRDQQSELRLQLASGEIQSVTLNGDYRWSPSFYGNLVFVSLAPIGWGVDYLTKTAYGFKNPETVQFKRFALGVVDMRPPVLVIAPPQSPWFSLSREVGEELYALIKERYPNKNVKNYDESREIFNKFHYSYDHRAEGEDLSKILYATAADQYVETNIEERNDVVRIKVAVRDAFTRNIIQSFVVEKPAKDYAIFRKSPTTRELSKYFAFFPNALGFDVGDYSSKFSVGKGSPSYASEEFVGKKVTKDGFDQWLGLLGSFNILYVRPPQTDDGWRFNFLFVPSLYVSALTFQYTEMPELHDVEFRRFRTGFGYGPQVSVSSQYGTLYLSGVPTVNYTRIKWGNDTGTKEREMGEFIMLVELGYQLFVSNNIAFRLFFKTWAENDQRWTHIISDAAGRRIDVETSNVNYGGATLIWYWPTLHDKGLQLFGFN